LVCKDVRFSLRAVDAGEDLVSVLGPGERPWVVVPVVDEGADRGHQFVHGGEGVAADGLAGDDREEALHEVRPGTAGRDEVQADPLVLRPGQPPTYLGMPVGCVITDDVQVLAGIGGGDLLQGSWP